MAAPCKHRDKLTNHKVPQTEENLLTSCATVSFSRRTVLHVKIIAIGYF
jgi:hypothetical protein